MLCALSKTLLGICHLNKKNRSVDSAALKKCGNTILILCKFYFIYTSKKPPAFVDATVQNEESNNKKGHWTPYGISDPKIEEVEVQIKSFIPYKYECFAVLYRVSLLMNKKD